MSMDLQIQFPLLRLRIPSDRRSALSESGIPPHNYSSSAADLDLDLDLDSAELCRTPRSEENRIQQLKSPPPPPRKKPLRRPAFKRKLKTDLSQFFESVRGSEEQLDQLFRSGFEFVKRNKSVIT